MASLCATPIRFCLPTRRLLSIPTQSQSQSYPTSAFIKPFSVSSRLNMAAAAKVKEHIANNTITVFSKSYCPYCKTAVETLGKTGHQMKVIELDNESDGDEQQEFLHQETKQRTVPNIFINQKHVGGNSDLQDLKAKGKLDEYFK